MISLALPHLKLAVLVSLFTYFSFSTAFHTEYSLAWPCGILGLTGWLS